MYWGVVLQLHLEEGCRAVEIDVATGRQRVEFGGYGYSHIVETCEGRYLITCKALAYGEIGQIALFGIVYKRF